MDELAPTPAHSGDVDHVIAVYSAVAPRWLGVRSDEDEPGTLATTRDPVFVARFDTAEAATAALRDQVRLHPLHSFRVETMARL